jgi:cell division protein FtsA
MQKQPYFIGLDIGTSRVRCVIGMPEPQSVDTAVSIIGVGTADNTGLRKGSVVHTEDTVRAITEAVASAERMAGVRVQAAVCNINGASVQSQASNGMVSTNSTDRIITESDRERVEEQAAVINMPNNREIVQVFAKNYRVDGQDYIKDPVGMHGMRLEVETLVITAGVQPVRSLEQVMNSAQVGIAGKTVSSVAASEAILSRKQRESGTAVVDIGAGTTNVAIIEDGEVYSVHVLPIGGQNVTNDLAIGLKTDLEVAEKVKLAYASLVAESAVSRDINITHNGTSYTFNTSRIYDVIVPRFEELFEEIDKVFAKMKRSKRLPGGVVLSGGVAQTPGIAAFATDQLELHTTVGKLQNVGGLADNVKSPEFSTAVGLMLLDGIFGITGAEQSGGSFTSGGGLFTKIKNTIFK